MSENSRGDQLVIERHKDGGYTVRPYYAPGGGAHEYYTFASTTIEEALKYVKDFLQ